MAESKRQYSALTTYVDAMIAGHVPTAPAFVCPTCSGPARISVSPRGELLSLSIRCPHAAVEMDGVQKWPGWEGLMRPLLSNVDPNPLSLRPIKSSRSHLIGRDGETTPCPYCHTPLATRLAKQCFVCGTDWHDPQNVVCRKNPEWNRFGLKWKSLYTQQLCQDPDGRRYTKYRLVDANASDPPDPNRVLETEPHPGWRWVAWGHYNYAQFVATTTGEKFTFDAHGIWLTWTEVRWLHQAARREVRRDSIPWASGRTPWFPPE